MKTVVVGSSGLMGSRIVDALRRQGVEVFEASKHTGVNVLTGEGLLSAFHQADVVIDATNSGSFGEGNALSFFKEAGANLLSAARDAKIRHYLVLSVVGANFLVENDYFRAKVVQENLLRASGVPHTVVRSTQFFEALNGVLDASIANGMALLPSIELQAIAADEAAQILAALSQEKAKQGTFNVGGPASAPLTELARELFTFNEDNRPILADPAALYFGVSLAADALLPPNPYASGKLTFHDWLSQSLHE